MPLNDINPYGSDAPLFAPTADTVPGTVNNDTLSGSSSGGAAESFNNEPPKSADPSLNLAEEEDADKLEELVRKVAEANEIANFILNKPAIPLEVPIAGDRARSNDSNLDALTGALDENINIADEKAPRLLPDLTPSPAAPDARTLFKSGTFTVGKTGTVGVEYLFDGGWYKGEVAIFSLTGMQQSPGSVEFIKEAARRALSDSDLGYVVIRDRLEAARFSGLLNESNQNSGEYQGVKNFAMRPEDEFGLMLVPNGTVQQVFDNPAVGGVLRPLFSMVAANPLEGFHFGQIADVTGDGRAFVMEDLRFDRGADRDYNDVIFRFVGATGTAVHLAEVINPAKDWRNSQQGQELLAYLRETAQQDSFDAATENPNPEDAISPVPPLISEEAPAASAPGSILPVSEPIDSLSEPAPGSTPPVSEPVDSLSEPAPGSTPPVSEPIDSLSETAPDRDEPAAVDSNLTDSASNSLAVSVPALESEPIAGAPAPADAAAVELEASDSGSVPIVLTPESAGEPASDSEPLAVDATPADSVSSLAIAPEKNPDAQPTASASESVNPIPVLPDTVPDEAEPVGSLPESEPTAIAPVLTDIPPAAPEADSTPAPVSPNPIAPAEPLPVEEASIERDLDDAAPIADGGAIEVPTPVAGVGASTEASPLQADGSPNGGASTEASSLQTDGGGNTEASPSQAEVPARAVEIPTPPLQAEVLARAVEIPTPPLQTGVPARAVEIPTPPLQTEVPARAVEIPTPPPQAEESAPSVVTVPLQSGALPVAVPSQGGDIAETVVKTDRPDVSAIQATPNPSQTATQTATQTVSSPTSPGQGGALPSPISSNSGTQLLSRNSTNYKSGIFTVGETGQVSVDFLFDGGAYKSQVAFFSLNGLDEFKFGSEEFVKEIARRSLSNSELGYVVIDDRAEGAKFAGELGEKNWNSGEYKGVKTFSMLPGAQFGIALVPDGSWQQVFDNPAIAGTKRPLISLETSTKPGQIADVTGDGHTIAWEDLRLNAGSDRDYNDIIFQISGATGIAPLLSSAINAAKDWQQTPLGEVIVNYADPVIGNTGFDLPLSGQPLLGIIDTGFSSNNPDIDYSRIVAGKDWIGKDNNPFLQPGESSEHGTHVLGLIAATRNNTIGIDGINDKAPLWVGRAVGSGEWAKSLKEFVDAAKQSGQQNAIANLSFDLIQVNPDGSVETRYLLTQEEREAIEYARQNGVLLVVAAGNDGAVMSALAQASQEFDNILTVGAADGMKRADYSSYGYGIDILAQGGTADNPILSTVGNGLGSMAGTSVATAYVTGAASQVWAANPDLSYQQVIEILKKTATDIHSPGWDLESGAGVLNSVAAVGLALLTEPKDYLTPAIAPGSGSEPKGTPKEREAGQEGTPNSGNGPTEAIKTTRPYVVQPGDTPGSVALEQLGSRDRWTEIPKPDGSPFTSPEQPLTPGTIIQLPVIYQIGNGQPQTKPPSLTPNAVPELLQFSTQKFYPMGDTFELTGKVWDDDGWQDVSRVDFWLQKDGGEWQNLGDVGKFTPDGAGWPNFSFSWPNLTAGDYKVKAIARDSANNPSNAVIETFTVLSTPEVKNLSNAVLQAIASATDLNNYPPEALADAPQWVVSVKSGQNPSELAASLGATNTGATGLIPNTYIWEFPDNTDPKAIAALSEHLGIEFVYPNIWYDLKAYLPISQFITSEPLFLQQWHLKNTGQTGGTIGADANVIPAWNISLPGVPLEKISGQDAVIGIVDDGVQSTHSDLLERYLAKLSYNFNAENPDAPAATLNDELVRWRPRRSDDVFSTLDTGISLEDLLVRWRPRRSEDNSSALPGTIGSIQGIDYNLEDLLVRWRPRRSEDNSSSPGGSDSESGGDIYSLEDLLVRWRPRRSDDNSQISLGKPGTEDDAIAATLGYNGLEELLVRWRPRRSEGDSQPINEVGVVAALGNSKDLEELLVRWRPKRSEGESNSIKIDSDEKAAAIIESGLEELLVRWRPKLSDGGSLDLDESLVRWRPKRSEGDSELEGFRHGKDIAAIAAEIVKNYPAELWVYGKPKNGDPDTVLLVSGKDPAAVVSALIQHDLDEVSVWWRDRESDEPVGDISKSFDHLWTWGKASDSGSSSVRSGEAFAQIGAVLGRDRLGALWERWREDKDENSDDNNASSGRHATPVAAIAAGSVNESGIVGAAFGAGIADIQLLGANQVTEKQIADALYYKNDSIAIYNNSWKPGTTLIAPPLSLWAQENSVAIGREGLGNIYVFASGNDGWDGGNVNYNGFANSRRTIAVGAIDHNGVASWYSEPGAALLVSAYSSGDGVGITTAAAGALAAYTDKFGGTSAAAPLVSGVIALMLTANPKLTQRDIQHILVKTARKNDPADPQWIVNGAGYKVNNQYGFGAIDAEAAVRSAISWTPVSEEVSVESPVQHVGSAIPDNNSAGITSTIRIDKDIKVEWAEVAVDIDHSWRGDLEVVLTSPDETESILAEPHYDPEDGYKWVFTSNRNWGESSRGEWTLQVRDRLTGETGTWNNWKLNLYGTQPIPDNSWVRQLGTVNTDGVRGMAVDSEGNVYLAGQTFGSLDGNINAGGINANWSDPFLTKYDDEGNKLWTRQIGSTGYDYYNDVTADGNGNVYTLGWGEPNIVKWDSSGNQLWKKTILATWGFDWATDITADSAGNVYVAGTTEGAPDGQNTDQFDAFAAKYDTQGNLIWMQRLETAGADQARSVAIDSAGNVYVAGVTDGALDGNTHAGGTDVFLTKYDVNGNKTWTRQFGTPAFEGGLTLPGVGNEGRNVEVAVDSLGNIYLSGTTEGAFEGYVNAGGQDGFVAKYNAEGNQLWINQLGTARNDRAWGVAVDSAGKVYVTGTTAGSLDGEPSLGGVDTFVTTYDRNGNKIATSVLGTPAEDLVSEIIVDRTGNVYTAGYTGGSLGSSNSGDRDAWVSKNGYPQIAEKPTVTISATDANAGEGGNPGEFVITRNGSTDSPLTVVYAVAGDATLGTDYIGLTGKVTIPAGVASVTIPIAPIDDAEDEENEKVELILAANPNYKVGAYSSAAIAIVDNDFPTVTIAATDANATEDGNAGQFVITRVGLTSKPLTVSYAIAGTATNGSDYKQLTDTVTIPAGASTATIPVIPIHDYQAEGNETVTLSLTDTAFYNLGADSSAIATIANSTTTSQYGPFVYVNPANGHVYILSQPDTWLGAQEQGKALGGNLVAINDAAENDWLVSTFVSSIRTWIGLTDSEIYGTTEGNFKWVNGEPVTYTNWYPSAPNNVLHTPEGEDFIETNFGIPGQWNDMPNNFLPGSNGLIDISRNGIIEIDPAKLAKPIVNVMVTDGSAGENGNAGQILITRIGNLDEALTVNYSVAGNAANGSDYNALSGSITIPAGESLVTIPIIPLPDYQVEGDEMLIVNLAAGDYAVGTRRAGQVTIIDQHPINRIANEVIGRDVSDLPYWTNRWQNGETLEQLRPAIIRAAKNTQGNYEAETRIKQIYQDVLGREADSSEVSYWRSRLETGATVSEVRQVLDSVIADSQSEFSTTQGQDNWYYGYYNGNLTDDDFHQFEQNDASSRWWIDGENFSTSNYWTNLTAFGGHPNGSRTTENRQRVDHWAVRRWVSEVDGEVSLFGNLAKTSVGNTQTTGIIGRILVDGVEVWSQPIDAIDGIGVNYAIDTVVKKGSIVDFAIDPRDSHDGSDSTKFTISIASKPGVEAIATTNPIYTNPATGHKYFLTAPDTWLGAQEQAAAAGGNLVTINDAAEQAWLVNVNTFGNGSKWIGLTDSPIYGATEGNYQWVNGQPVAYTDWRGQDNVLHTPEGEDFIEMGWGTTGKWNDMPSQQNWIRQGIVEIPSNPTATNLNFTQTYTEDITLDLTDIVIADPDGQATVTLKLDNPAAGILTTGASGGVNSTYNAATGTWTATGAVADVNALLASLQFQPAKDFNEDVAISVTITDDIAAPLVGTINLKGTPVNYAPTVEIEPTRIQTRQLGSTGYDVANDVAVDSAGNVYFTGWVRGALDGNTYQGGSGLPGASGDGFLMRYDAEGDRLWTRTLGSTADDAFNGVAVDSAGNAYVVGSTSGALDGHANLGLVDGFFAKYDANGNIVWSRQIGTADNDELRHVVTDGAGNIYTVGNTSGLLDGSSSGYGADALLIKWDSDGNILWTRQFNNAGHSIGSAVDFDPTTGSIYIAGHGFGSVDGQPNAGGLDAFVVRYDSNGNLIWTRQLRTSANDSFSDLDIDNNGNILVAGSTKGTLLGNTSAGGQDAFAAQYDSSGNLLWARQFGTAGEDNAAGVGVDSNGNVFVTGAFEESPGAGSWDAFLTEFDSNGDRFSWTQQVSTPGWDGQGKMTFDANGNLYTAAWAQGSIDGQPYAGSLDPLVMKYAVTQTYTEDTALDLKDIIIRDKDPEDTVTATLTLSDVNAGILTTEAINGTSSTFENGVWRVSGAATDVNALLANIKFIPATNYNRDLAIAASVSDNVAPTVTSTINLKGTPVNDAPTVEAIAPLSGATENQPFTITYDRLLAASNATDADGDAISFKIDAVASGTLTKNGQPVVPGVTTLAPGESVVWIPNTAGDAVPAFSVSATDGKAASESKEVAIAVFPADPWIRQLGTANADHASGFTVDSAGNVYIAGTTRSSLDGNTNGSGAGAIGSDPFIAKYDANGNKLWTRQIGSPGTDYYHDVAVDSTGNLYTVGYDDGSPGNVGGAVLIAKWDNSGNLVWRRWYDTQAQDSASGITTDSEGNIYIAGMSDYSVRNLGGNADAFVAKYNPQGDRLWVQHLGTDVQDQARSVAADSAGNIYVAGVTEGSLDGNSAGGTDVFLTKYNLDGSKLWTRQLGSDAADGYISLNGGGEFSRNVQVAVDSAGNIYISGATEGSLDGNANAGGQDAFVAKYDPTGSKLWTRQLGTAQHDRAWGVTVDSAGTVYITGTTEGSLDGKTNLGSVDTFVTAYDSNGNKLSTRLLGTTANDQVRDIASDRTGNIYTTGYTSGSLGDTNAGNQDAWVSKNAFVNMGPIYTNPANGNRYFLTTADTWIGAQNQAVAAGGNLVTINDAAEQAWLVTTFGSERFYIGLTDSERYGTTEGNFKWVSGQPMTYTNWGSSFDNALFIPEGEDFGEMVGGVWNDLSSDLSSIGYQNPRGIVEIEANPRTEVNYSDFSAIAGLNLLGTASQVGDKLRLTPITSTGGAGAKAGAAWHAAKQSVADGFETTFQFQINDLVNGGADGFAFVIQNDSASFLGGTGGGMGYTAISNSLAIELDTHFNVGPADPNDNHISVHTGGTGVNSVSNTPLGSTTAIPNLSDGKAHTVKVEYVPGTLRIFIDDLATPALTVPVDLADTLNLDSGKAWVGFTSGTALRYENHDILNWTLSNPPTISIAATDATASEDGDTGEITITRTGSTAQPLTVNYSTAGSAIPPEDYNTFGTITIPAGASSVKIPIAIIDDSTVEGSETLVVNLTDNADYMVGNASSATVEIADNDPSFTFSGDSSQQAIAQTYTEDTPLDLTNLAIADPDGETTVTLTLSNPAAGVLTNSTINGMSSTYNPVTGVWRATGAVADVNALLATVKFEPAQDFNGEVAIAVSISDDKGAPQTGTINLTGTPVNDAPTVEAIAPLTGATESASFTITYDELLAAAKARDVDGDTLTFRIESLGADLLTKQGQPVVPGTTTLSPGESLVWKPTTSGNAQPAFSFSVSDGTVTLPAPVQVAIDVIKPTVTLKATDPDATESGDAGEFTITRTGSTENPLTVTYSIEGEFHWSRPKATNGTDYKTIPTSITIPAGASSVTIPIHPLEDTQTEWPETVRLKLTGSDGYQLGNDNLDAVIIWDNEPSRVQLYAEWYTGQLANFHLENYASESGNTATLGFRRVGDISKPLTVDFSLTGTATNGADYELPQSITFAADEWDHWIYFTPINDNEVEGEETVVLTITPSQDYTILENWGTRVTTIWDNDGKPSVTIKATDPKASEYGDKGQFTFTRTGDTSNPLTVDYLVSPHWWWRAKNDGKDFEQIPESITIPAGASSVTIDINPIDDNEVEQDELVDVFLKSNPAYAIGGAQEATVTILDNETQKLAWKQQLGSSADDSANAVASDSDGNTYIVGRAEGNLAGTNAGRGDLFIAKYGSSGNVQWKHQLGTSSDEEAKDIVIDSAGNLYVLGWSETGGGWIAKYDSNGSQAWTKPLGADYDISKGAIAIGADNSLYLTGSTAGNLEATNQGKTDAWVAKYNSDGSEVWVKQLGTADNDDACGITVDSNGNVYIAGSTKGAFAGTREGDGDAWVAKFNDSGVLQWKQQLGTIAEDIARSVAVDNNGHVYLTGKTYGWLGDTYSGSTNDWVGDSDAWWRGIHGDKTGLGGTYFGNGDAWVAQFDADGNLKWKRLIGTAAADDATGVVADSLGNVYIVGTTAGKLGDKQVGGSDIFVAKYNVKGALQWKQQIGSAGEDVANDIVLDDTGIAIAGSTSGNLQGTNKGGEDAWIAKLS